jgi:hypothetical protein
MNRRTATRFLFMLLWVGWVIGSLGTVLWLRQTVTAPPGDPGYTASAITFALCLIAGAGLLWRTLERLSTRSIRDIQEHSSGPPHRRSDRGSKVGNLR